MFESHCACVPVPTPSVLEILVAAAVLGLVGSPHCIGMCGPFAVACGGRAGNAFAWQAGKLLTYAALGALAGGLGGAIGGPVWIGQAVSAVLVVWFSAALAGLTPEPSLRVPGLSRLAARASGHPGITSSALLGVANGLLPCGLVYAALALAVASGSASVGALAMIAFGLGTAPLVTTFALGSRRLLAERPWARRVLALAVLVVGLWVVIQRGGMTPGGM